MEAEACTVHLGGLAVRVEVWEVPREWRFYF